MRKHYNQKSYSYGKIKIDCWTEDTSYGFRHLAILNSAGNYPVNAKCCYYNRTWESYEYESVINGAIEKSIFLTDSQKRDYKRKIHGQASKQVNREFGMLGAIMKMGEVLASNQKDKNDWKTKMLEAALGNKGLIMPEDWGSLTEDEKTKRLDGVIDTLKK